MDEILERLADRFTGPELLDLLDVPMNELVELLRSPYIEDNLEELGEYVGIGDEEDD